MKILAHIPFFMPLHNAGAETMIYDIFRYLMSKGHKCSVVCDSHTLKEWNGINIYVHNVEKDNIIDLRKLYNSQDIVIGHLGRTGTVYNYLRGTNKMQFHIAHNTNRDTICHVKPNQAVIYNSEYVKGVLKYPAPSVLCRPYAKIKDYAVNREGAEYITLIGTNKNKGGQFLQQLAKLMPDKKFMAVRGAYGVQVELFPDNVTVVEHTDDIKSVYSKTKILLVPSISETWCRVASEAMCSGIPIIYNPCKGLIENIDYGGIAIQREDLVAYKRAIDIIEKDYNHYCELSFKRAEEQNGWDDLERLENFLIKNHEVKSFATA